MSRPDTGSSLGCPRTDWILGRTGVQWVQDESPPIGTNDEDIFFNLRNMHHKHSSSKLPFCSMLRILNAVVLDFFGAAMHQRKAGRAGVVVDGFLDGLDGFLLADFSMFGLFERGPS